MTIFDLMTSQNIVAYWEVLLQDEAPYPCEELFPDDKKRGISLKWIKGAKGLPVVLKTSAFDAAALLELWFLLLPMGLLAATWCCKELISLMQRGQSCYSPKQGGELWGAGAVKG